MGNRCAGVALPLIQGWEGRCVNDVPDQAAPQFDPWLCRRSRKPRRAARLQEACCVDGARARARAYTSIDCQGDRGHRGTCKIARGVDAGRAGFATLADLDSDA